MSSRLVRSIAVGLVATAAVSLPRPAFAQKPPAAQKGPATSANTPYDDLFAKYLEEARNQPASPAQWMIDLTGDRRARHLNDLVTVSITEAISASGAADATVNKSSDSSGALPAPLATPLGKILPATSATKFAGNGSTSRTTTMNATMTARVSEILPNGDLVVEGVREIDVNGDRQIVVLTGVVRPFDIGPANVVSSASIGQLRIQSLGKGLIKDSLSPGWLVRVLNKIF